MSLDFSSGIIYLLNWLNQYIYLGLDFVKKKIHNKYIWFTEFREVAKI